MDHELSQAGLGWDERQEEPGSSYLPRKEEREGPLLRETSAVGGGGRRSPQEPG